MATASARLLSLDWLRGTFLAAPPAPRDEWASLAATLLDTSSWTLLHFVCFGVAVQVGFEFYRTVVPRLFSRASSLQARGRHLDSFSARDKAYIATNMALVQLMAFHYFQLTATSPAIPWRLDRLTLANSAVALPLCFVLYDLFYATLHRALHHRAIYAYVHKHHHRQIVPTRGNPDAINVHPLEFLLGEYIHILAVYLTTLVVECHALTCLSFLVLGGTLATLNHTRLDVRLKLPGVGWWLFDVRAHDTHHCAPMSNFGQYTMLWDVLMGTYKDYYAVSGTKKAE